MRCPEGRRQVGAGDVAAAAVEDYTWFYGWGLGRGHCYRWYGMLLLGRCLCGILMGTTDWAVGGDFELSDVMEVTAFPCSLLCVLEDTLIYLSMRDEVDCCPKGKVVP